MRHLATQNAEGIVINKKPLRLTTAQLKTWRDFHTNAAALTGCLWKKKLNSGIGQRSTEPWTKRRRELLIFQSNSRPDLAGAQVEKTVFLQYGVDLGTL